MTDFLERLPLRLAALAGLLVGVASVVAGTDLWVTLIRVGVAFALFGGLGMGLRALLRVAPPRDKPNTPTPPEASQESETGSHVDQKTPEMTVDDLK